MKIELNKTTFRRFVQLYLAMFLLSIPLIVWQVLDPTYEEFDLDFQGLVALYYGHTGYSDWEMVATGFLLLSHLASGVGLLWVKRWARLLFWSSLVLLSVFDAMVGAPVEWLSRWASWGQVLGSAIFGAIVILSYASGLGAVWFKRETESQRTS